MKPNEPYDIKISFYQKNHNDSFDFDGKGGSLTSFMVGSLKSKLGRGRSLIFRPKNCATLNVDICNRFT